MADTRRLAMLKAVAAALDGVGKPTGLIVHRFAHRPLTKDRFPCLIVAHGGGINVDDDVNDLQENTDRVLIAIRCLGDADTAPDDSIDPYLSWVETALQADLTLGGEINRVDMEPTGQTDAEESDRVYVQIIQPIAVKYYHRRTNPESAS